MKPIIYIPGFVLASCLLTGCLGRQPGLHLYWADKVQVNVEFNIQWEYDILAECDEEWTYGWDREDSIFFGGPIGYSRPTAGYELRRYYLGDDPNAPHAARPVQYWIDQDGSLTTDFSVGYYDMLSWTDFPMMEVQSTIIDESDSHLDYVDAYTNQNPNRSSRGELSAYDYVFNQPDQLFAGYKEDFYISDDFEDYDWYDEETHTYHLKSDMLLTPVTYIYLIQLRLHNNNGRVKYSGEGCLTGMARGVNLNTKHTYDDPIEVQYATRFKHDVPILNTGEVVDVIGTRCMTFGIPGQDYGTSGSKVNTSCLHTAGFDLRFSTGYDSTFVFDVSDQVHKYYRGGILTVDINVDTLNIPSPSGSSGLDAKVEDFDNKEFEFQF